MDNQIIHNVNISTIKSGDTIIHNNKLTTVCAKDIKHNNFSGHSLFGDSYNSGYKKVKKVTFKRF